MSRHIGKSKGQRLLSPSSVAALLSVDERTLSNWRYRSSGPAFVKVGARIAYPLDALSDFIEANRST